MSEQPEEHAPVESQDPGAGFEPDVEPDLQVHAADELLDDDLPAHPGPATSVSTGHPAVDEVLRSLEGLDGRPVDEHVAAFEQAHEVLRRALSNAGDEPVARPED